MNDYDLLMTTICQNPNEDTPRLVMADWLQENGDEARAEFIRLQCELAVAPPVCAYACNSRMDYRCKWCELRDRESELLAANRDRWLRVPCYAVGPYHGDVCSGGQVQAPNWQFTVTCKACMGTGDAGGLETEQGVTEFRRGFPDELKGCRLGDIFERPLYSAGQDSEAYGNWQTTNWITRVFRHHPITRLPLTDIEQPIQLPLKAGLDGSKWFWPLRNLPEPIRDWMKDVESGGPFTKHYDTAAIVIEECAKGFATVIRRLTFPAPELA